MPYVRDVPQNEFLYTRSDAPRARPLIDELSREYDERYGLNDGIPSSVELSRYPAERFAPETGGAFLLVLRLNGMCLSPVSCGCDAAEPTV